MSKQDKGRLPLFVPLLKDTLASPAWLAMSHGAKILYVALKARYHLHSVRADALKCNARARVLQAPLA